MLCSLIYASKALAKMDYGKIREISEEAATRNASLGVTGLLIYGSMSFLQVLEGERDIVSQTYLRISKDKRHHSPVLIGVSDIAQRSFQQWAMRAVMLDGINGAQTKSMLIKYGANEQFQPFTLSSRSANGFLVEFVNGVQNVTSASTGLSDSALPAQS